MSKKFIVIVACGAVGLALLLNGCAGTKVKRVAVEEQIDLSGNWNDTDSRLVSEEMIKDCLARPWKDVFTATDHRQPKVIVGTIRNHSSEHIAVETFTKDLERALINSGQVGFVASKNEREEIRDEKVDQAENARKETAKATKQETGADFMLQGDLNTIVDMSGKKAVKFYQVNLELVNILNHEKVWIGEKQIKKLVTNPKFKP
jgi:penicillin-binding protein activator